MPHVSPSQTDDPGRHRCGEQHRLAKLGCQPDDLLHVRKEAEIEHLVGLVEHEHLDVPEIEMTLVGQVEQASRRADDDVDPRAEHFHLRLVRATAVDASGSRTSRTVEAVRRSAVTCTASSRVGTTTRACGLPGAAAGS